MFKQKAILYFPIAHNSLCLPPQILHKLLLWNSLGRSTYSQEHFRHNNSLCKIWGANGVNYGQLKNRELRNFCLLYYLGKWCDNALLSNFRSIICQVVAYGRLKAIENFKTSRSKDSRGRFTREVVAYKRFQIQWFYLETFGILENWSLKRDGRLR